jgi:hypothetical protein
MSPIMHMPPPGCPNEGVCLTLGPRVDQHEAALSSLGTDIGALKRDVHEIKVTLRERDNLMGFLKTVFVALLSIFFLGLSAVVGQVVMTARWMAQTDMKFEAIANSTHDIEADVADHEQRLRAHGSYINGQNP